MYKAYHAPCQFDSGVPLIQDNTVVGLFSFNRGCGMNEIASVFTSISAYESWILDQADQQPLNCIETNRPTTISTAMPTTSTTTSTSSSDSCSNSCAPPSTCPPFVCPSPNGNFPITPEACTSQYYVCIECTAFLQVFIHDIILPHIFIRK